MPATRCRFRTLVALMGLAPALLSPSASALVDAAQEAPASEAPPDRAADPWHPVEMEGVVVHAIPGAHGDAPVTPVAVLAGEALEVARAATLGATVANVPGVQTTALGQAVGRPVIRGLDGPRVAITSNGLGVADASSVSQDHAVAIEPFLADQVEILKGPAALLFGPGAIGGVVNVVDGRIPEFPALLPLSGRLIVHADEASSGYGTAFRLDGGQDRIAWHLDGARREAGDYALPRGRLANSALASTRGAAGVSLVGDWGHFGASVSRYLDRYDSPAEPGDPETGEGAAWIGLGQTTLRVQSAWIDPLPGLQALELALAHSNYDHTEYEDDAAETRFASRSRELHLRADHAARRAWRGSVGLQLGERDFEALGEEAFLPPARTRTAGLFVFEQADLGAWRLEAGARLDQQRITAREQPGRTFHPLNLSAGLAWRPSAAWRWTLNLDRSQRAPGQEELLADGPHAASATWETGNPQLGLETARQVELGIHLRGRRVDANLAVYRNRFDGFIYLADTGERIDHLPVRAWSQSAARFRGFEAEAAFHLRDDPDRHLDLVLTADAVRARLRDGSNLPRIPVARLGAALNWDQGPLTAQLRASAYARQRHRAEHETPTAGFLRLDLHAAWLLHENPAQVWQLFVTGENLGNQRMHLATSLFKDVAPLPGRSLSVGLRSSF